jgi:hypothetical protein
MNEVPKPLIDTAEVLTFSDALSFTSSVSRNDGGLTRLQPSAGRKDKSWELSSVTSQEFVLVNELGSEIGEVRLLLSENAGTFWSSLAK